MTLLLKNVFGISNYATQTNVFFKIHGELVEFIEHDKSQKNKLQLGQSYTPSGKILSDYFNCKHKVNKSATDWLLNSDTKLCMETLRKISAELQASIIDPKPSTYIKLVSTIIYIIEHDDQIDAATYLGKDKNYTRKMILSAEQIDLTEFLANILFYILTNSENKSTCGQDTVNWITSGEYKTIKIRNIIVIPYKNNFICENDSSISISKECKDLYEKNNSISISPKGELLSNELTNGTFNVTFDDVLFRYTDYQEIINLLHTSSPNILVNGMGGCGKTSLVRLIYSNIKDEYDCYGWINYNHDLKQSFLSSIHIGNQLDNMINADDIQENWLHLFQKLSASSQTKLFVIDNVDSIDNEQNPITDKELHSISNLPNTTIIITSRLSYIPGFSNIYTLKNLGNDTNCDKCIELFYFYNKNIAKNREQNTEIIKKLCKLAGYNTLVIELLSKGCQYYTNSLNEYYELLCKNHFQIPDECTILTSHDYNDIITNNRNTSYYSIGNETIASQLYKLFNIASRRSIEQVILWDFHYLPENFKVSKYELKNVMGFQTIDIDQLVKEGWIKYEDDYFFLHPLVRQAIYCSPQTWEYYWNIKNNFFKEGTISNNLINSIKNHLLFSNNDNFENDIRKIEFANYLTYCGKCLDVEEWIYIADYSRKKGLINISLHYYSLIYDKLHDKFIKDGYYDKNTMYIYWKSAYYYGYLLSYTKSGYSKAEFYIREALNIAEEIYCQNVHNDFHIQMLAASLDHLGYILATSGTIDIGKVTETDYILTEATELRRLLCEAHPSHFKLLHDYAWSLDNLGTFYSTLNNKKIIFTKNPNNNDIEYLSDKEAMELYNSCETILQEALTIRKALAEARSEINSTEVAWTCFNLASLLLKKGKYPNAETYIMQALEIYQRINQTCPGLTASSEAKTLVLYAKLLTLTHGSNTLAIETLNKALSLYSSLENTSDYSQEIKNIKILLSENQTINHV